MAASVCRCLHPTKSVCVSIDYVITESRSTVRPSQAASLAQVLPRGGASFGTSWLSCLWRVGTSLKCCAEMLCRDSTHLWMISPNVYPPASTLRNGLFSGCCADIIPDAASYILDRVARQARSNSVFWASRVSQEAALSSNASVCSWSSCTVCCSATSDASHLWYARAADVSVDVSGEPSSLLVQTSKSRDSCTMVLSTKPTTMPTAMQTLLRRLAMPIWWSTAHPHSGAARCVAPRPPRHHALSESPR